MADEEKDEAADKGAKGGSGPSFVMGTLVPAIVAAAAGFGGAYAAKASQPDPNELKKQKEEAAKMPGPTVRMKAFIFNAVDADGGQHAVKLMLAIELSNTANVDRFTRYKPRLRDAALEYLRNVKFEEIRDTRKTARFTQDLLAKFHAVGAKQVTRVLMLDLITQ